ncbi:hypothetical protein BKA93DRAFT_750192 [Sparassis latifolia]
MKLHAVWVTTNSATHASIGFRNDGWHHKRKRAEGGKQRGTLFSHASSTPSLGCAACTVQNKFSLFLKFALFLTTDGILTSDRIEIWPKEVNNLADVKWAPARLALADISPDHYTVSVFVENNPVFTGEICLDWHFACELLTAMWYSGEGTFHIRFKEHSDFWTFVAYYRKARLSIVEKDKHLREQLEAVRESVEASVSTV